MVKCVHCEHEFEVDSPEQVSIYNPAARTLSIKCPECNRNTRVGKSDSEKIIEKFPDLEREIEQAKIREDEGTTIGGFEEKFREALSIFGLESKKYETKIKAILKLIDRTGASRDWLKYHLQRLNFTNKPTIDSIVDLVFLDEGDQPNMPAPTYTGGPSAGAGGYSVQTLPGGQVILIPQAQTPQIPQAAQPIIIGRGEPSEKIITTSEQVVEEVLDGEGNVTKRIIKTAPHKTPEAREDNTLKLLTTLKDIGLIHPPQQQQAKSIPDEISITLGTLKQSVADLGEKIKGGAPKPESEEMQKLTGLVTTLTAKIDAMEKERAENETRSLREELASLKQSIAALSSRPEATTTPKGLSDTQFEIDTKHRSLKTVTEAGDRLGERIITPLNKLLESQQKINSLLLVRDIEKQDGVAPGTYLKALTPTPSPTDTEVKDTVEKWTKRASEVRGG